MLRIDCSAKVALMNEAADVSFATHKNKARSEATINSQPLFSQQLQFFIPCLLVLGSMRVFRLKPK
jgi:hypothetical protein